MLKNVNNGKREPIPVNSPRDIEILIKLGLLIQGESTERTETKNTNQFNTDTQKQILDEGSDE